MERSEDNDEVVDFMTCVMNTIRFRKGVFVTVPTEVYRGYMQPVLPVPDTSVSSVQHQYRYRTLQQVWYDINTGNGHFAKFGTTLSLIHI